VRIDRRRAGERAGSAAQSPTFPPADIIHCSRLTKALLVAPNLRSWHQASFCASRAHVVASVIAALASCACEWSHVTLLDSRWVSEHAPHHARGRRRRATCACGSRDSTVCPFVRRVSSILAQGENHKTGEGAVPAGRDSCRRPAAGRQVPAISLP
jgi:hypothetical protein